MRSPGNYVGGHMIDPISDREVFVSSLRAMASPNIHSDGCAAKFCRQLVFEFCNTIFPDEAEVDRTTEFAISVETDPSETWAAPNFRSAKASFVLR